MQMISSEAGTRLAKARAAVLRVNELFQVGGTQGLYHAYLAAWSEYEAAAEALADELIASGYHDLDGGEA